MVTVEIKGGPSFQIQWFSGMNGRDALQNAYNASKNQGDFTFSLQYYGSKLGYLVDMINETYDTFISKYEPYYFWEFLINGKTSQTGIDQTVLNDNDIISFQFVAYTTNTHVNTTLQTKYKLKKMAFSEN
ncbi:MAG: DUF4430 domain-containing protein [Bacteroidota bacterium]